MPHMNGSNTIPFSFKASILKNSLKFLLVTFRFFCSRPYFIGEEPVVESVVEEPVTENVVEQAPVVETPVVEEQTPVAKIIFF